MPLKVGAYDYVLKPFKLNALLPLLARAMEVRRLRQENVELRESLAVHELARTVALTLDPEQIVGAVADAAMRQFRVHDLSIVLTGGEVAYGTRRPVDVPLVAVTEPVTVKDGCCCRCEPGEKRWVCSAWPDGASPCPKCEHAHPVQHHGSSPGERRRGAATGAPGAVACAGGNGFWHRPRLQQSSLSAILGFTETMLMFPEDMADAERVTECLTTVQTIARDVATLVERLREFYRPREGMARCFNRLTSMDWSIRRSRLPPRSGVGVPRSRQSLAFCQACRCTRARCGRC